MRRRGFLLAVVVAALWCAAPLHAAAPIIKEFSVPKGSHPHDVAPARDGGVWYTAQHLGELGWLDPVSGHTRHIPLGRGSASHGVIVGPDGAPWITDSGQNAIVRVDPRTEKVQVFALPKDKPNANLNTATFDRNGILWFTGQTGYYGRLDPKTGQATVLEPPTLGQGARRVWADSKSRIWVSEWNSGQVSLYDPKSNQWRAWKLPGDNPQTYAVYVDSRDIVWLSGFGADAMVRFDPKTERFKVIRLPSHGTCVRQILGRPGEVWLPLSGVDKLAVIRE